MHYKKLLPSLSLSFLSLLALSACNSIQIKNSEWCADLGNQGATCVHTLSDDKRKIEKTAWDTERFGMLCTSAQSFSDLKAALEKLCAVSKKCSMEDKKKLNEAFGRLESIGRK